MAVDEYGNEIEETGMLTGTVTDPVLAQEAGQQVAQATGVAYEQPAKTPESEWAGYEAEKVAGQIEEDAAVKAGESYVTDKSTVAGQLDVLLSDESDYIKLARERAKQEAAGRGMLSSSAAMGAAQTAAIEAAMPIATQDASTYAQAQLTQQQTESEQAKLQAEAIVSGELSRQNADIKQTHQDIQNKFTELMKGVDQANKLELQGMMNDFNKSLTQMELASKEAMQSEQITAAQSESLKIQASTIMQNYQVSIENMLTDPDFLDMTPTAKQNAINQTQTLARNSIKFLGASFGQNMDAIVNQYLKDLKL